MEPHYLVEFNSIPRTHSLGVEGVHLCMGYSQCILWSIDKATDYIRKIQEKLLILYFIMMHIEKYFLDKSSIGTRSIFVEYL